MRRLAVPVVLVCLYPAISSAAVTVRFEDLGTVVPTTQDQVIPVEIFATNPESAENERLNAYTIAVDAPDFGTAAGQPRFLIPAQGPGGQIPFDEPTTHPYVFGAYPGNGPVDPADLSDANTVLLSAALGGTGQEADISPTRNGFAKLNILVPANARGGVYRLNLTPEFLSLGSAGEPIVAVPLNALLVVQSDPGIPEPAAPSLLLSGGVMVLLRRRPAQRPVREG